MPPFSLDGVNLALSIIAATVGLIVIAGGVWAILTTSRKDQTEKRLRAWNEDLTNRLDYVEPQLQKLEAQNKMLRDLHNPTALLGTMSATQKENHEAIMRVLNAQHETVMSSISALKGKEG